MTDVAVALFSALAGFLVWMSQRYFERKAVERLRREKLYGSLLSACVEFIASGNGAPFIIESQRAWLYASDQVLRSINEYLKAFVAYGSTRPGEADHAKTWEAIKAAEADLRLTIRKDLLPKTQLGIGWMTQQWEMVTSTPERIKEYLERKTRASDREDSFNS